jgi:hypothetical protein
MIIPQSLNEFNNWNDMQRRNFVDLETAGHHFANTAGVIVYPGKFTIEYTRDWKGKLKKVCAKK